MYQIQHIAIRSHENEALAEFYARAFGLVEVKRHAPEGRPDRLGIYLTDGHLNLALIPAAPGGPEGIDHFGFKVDEMEAARRGVLAAGGTPGSDQVPRDGRFAEAFVLDPVGTRVDLSVAGWDVQLPARH